MESEPIAVHSQPDSNLSLNPSQQKVHDAFPSIMSEISEGDGLVKCLRKRKLNAWPFFQLLSKSEQHRETYARAKETRRDLRFEQISDIAFKAKPENAHVGRLQIDAIKWQLSKEDPQRYGEHGTGVTINNTTNILAMDDAALERLHKARQSLISQGTD